MVKSARTVIQKNAVTLAAICGLALVFLYGVGQFTELHPDAYRDLIRSILMGYGIYLTGYGLYHGVYKKFIVKRTPAAVFTESAAPSDNVTRTVVSRKKNLQITDKKSIGKMKETPLEAVCVTFTVITLLNSVMMLVGMDTPKEGTFAYLHMMTRLLIITGIITVFMWKDVWPRVKTFKLKKIFSNFLKTAQEAPVRGTAKAFTFITAVYCILVIALQRILHPPGGPFFYQSLLGILAVTAVGMLSIRIFRRDKRD